MGSYSVTTVSEWKIVEENLWMISPKIQRNLRTLLFEGELLKFFREWFEKNCGDTPTKPGPLLFFQLDTKNFVKTLLAGALNLKKSPEEKPGEYLCNTCPWAINFFADSKDDANTVFDIFRPNSNSCCVSLMWLCVVVVRPSQHTTNSAIRESGRDNSANSHDYCESCCFWSFLSINLLTWSVSGFDVGHMLKQGRARESRVKKLLFILIFMRCYKFQFAYGTSEVST